MKKIIYLIISVLFLGATCLEKDTFINDPESVDYNIEKIYSNEKIIWSFEFINEKTIIFTEKKGKMYLLINGDIQEIAGVPEIYFTNNAAFKAC